MNNSILGIIGGGQLGRMTVLAAARLGIKCYVYDPNPDSPAFQVCAKCFIKDFDDEEAIREFASSVDAALYEFENIPINTAKIIEDNTKLRPSANILFISQDRLVEKTFLFETAKVNTAKYFQVNNINDLSKALNAFGGKGVLKTRRFGYDGKGQIKIDGNINVNEVFNSLDSEELILEEFVPFKRELSIIIARDVRGNIKIYDCVENIHKNHILDITIAPAPSLSEKISDSAKSIAIKVAESLNLNGLLAIELFELKNQNLLVNEIAPRPHNSGHWTMDGCITDQFEQAVRAALGLDLGSVKRIFNIKMKNLIGDDIKLVKNYINEPNHKIHLYGKKEIRKGRKMGHINQIV